MVDHHFSDTRLAALYDLLHPWAERDDLQFYLPLVLAAESVLDVGCGTGLLLHQAREAGHTGRLCGLDPAAGMLEVARQRSDIEWVRGDLSTSGWDREFDLIVMTGHAFQVLLTDDELHTALDTVRTALTPGGRFAFETRNPLVRAWERWIPEYAVERVDPTGVVIRMEHQVDLPTSGDVVRFTTTYTGAGSDRPEVSRSTLRFLDTAALSTFLSDAGLRVDEQFGDWDRNPLTDASPEIITIASRR